MFILRMSERVTGIVWLRASYPLVNIYITMEHHHVQWETLTKYLWLNVQ